MSVLRSFLWHRRAARAAMLIALGALLAHCVSEHEILGQLDTGPDGGSDRQEGGNDTPLDGGWTESTCYNALANGTNGQSCSDAFRCQGAGRSPCCRRIATCSGGMLSIDEVCDKCPCTDDSDCAGGHWCINGSCVPCPAITPSTCVPPLLPTFRNGCAWCVTSSQCGTISMTPCAPGLVCYPGRPCKPGSENDPTYCQGNICAAPGCPPTTNLDCSVAGCADGFTCSVTYRGQSCMCSGGQWYCSPSPQNICQAF